MRFQRPVMGWDGMGLPVVTLTGALAAPSTAWPTFQGVSGSSRCGLMGCAPSLARSKTDVINAHAYTSLPPPDARARTGGTRRPAHKQSAEYLCSPTGIGSPCSVPTSWECLVGVQHVRDTWAGGAQSET